MRVKAEKTMVKITNFDDCEKAYIGVYFLIKDEDVIYIGSSVNVLDRIRFHKRDGKKFDYVYLKPFNTNELLFQEDRYIIEYQPKYNKNLNNTKVNYLYISSQLTKKLGFNPYSTKLLKDVILKSNYYIYNFRGKSFIDKECGDKIIARFEYIYKNFIAKKGE